jgi:tetratricopeptide (TPR) repeat protein
VILKRSRFAVIAAAGCAALFAPSLVSAQSAGRAIVQPIPPRASAALNRALRTLARSPRNLDALISAGDASLELSDAEAASGFFSRARQVEPNNARVLLGLARSQLKLGRPVSALQMFDEAERSGAKADAIAADRALALDLVGDNAGAQSLYLASLEQAEDPELRRRLALSHAIDGNKAAFERELYAQLEKGDRAAFRSRAFGLAILGEDDEAVKITEAMMPTDLALRMSPYLRYMPRLTKAQQAAAANLGVFPRAANIGRDNPTIAGYAAASHNCAGKNRSAG